MRAIASWYGFVCVCTGTPAAAQVLVCTCMIILSDHSTSRRWCSKSIKDFVTVSYLSLSKLAETKGRDRKLLFAGISIPHCLFNVST